MEKVDVVVVGAGLAGLATAYVLADHGFEVLVVERGDYPGSKNVTGGRLYLNPVRSFFPDLWDDAPLERPVTRERLTVMSQGAATTLDLTSQRLRRQPYHSYTVLRSRFDRWFADRVGERGALVISKYKVDDVLLDGGRVVGIRSGDDEIGADVVVAADGALSFIVEKAGLRGRHDPAHFAVGVKEVIELSPQVIEDRFNVAPGEGAAQLFFGAITEGLTGGGFLYTNRDSLSLGLVVSIKALMERDPPLPAHELMQRFCERPEIQVLIDGGEIVEYSAHTIPEGGLQAMPRLFADGIVVVGDAAGLALNMGLTVRGMDAALASGALAARTIMAARDVGDYSAVALAQYETLLKDSFVVKDLHTFSHMLHFLENPRLFGLYPDVVCGLLEKVMWIGQEPKEKLSATVMGQLRPLLSVAGLRDLFALRKL